MLVVDVETTGLDPQYHSIVSIGAVEFERPERQFYGECRMFDGAQIDPQALSINGFTEQQLSDATRPSLNELVGNFLSWASSASDQTLAGHNAFFDRDCLRASCERYRMPWPFGYRMLDLYSVCWAHMVKSGREVPVDAGLIDLKSRLIYAYVGLPSEPKPHHGLVGAKMEAEALSRLVHGHSLLSEFGAYPLPEHLSGNLDYRTLL